jgi:hypothetical protein
MKSQWKNYLWSVVGFVLFVVLFWLANLFIACMALIGCLFVQWITMSAPSEEKTQVLLHGTVFIAVFLSVFGLYYLNRAGNKMAWPEWYVFGQSSKTAMKTEKKTKTENEEDAWRETLRSLNLIAGNTSMLIERLGDMERKNEERDAALHGKLDSGDFSKVKPIIPSIVLPEEIPDGDFNQVIPKRVEPKKPTKPAKPDDWQPVLPKKGDWIPSISPKEPLPDLLVQANKQGGFDEPATHVLGTCGRAHKIIDWTADGQPVYGPCWDITGRPACECVPRGTIKWK